MGTDPTSQSSAPVAVVVVTWNAAAFLEACFSSLRSLERPPREIVVVDNDSRDGSPEIARRRFPEAQLLALGSNCGFCHANNVGIRATRAPFVLVLNPDTRLEPGFVEQLLPAFDDPRVGMVAGKLLRFDGVTLDSCGQMLARSRQPLDRGYGRRDRGQFDRDEAVFGVCGAAALYRRSMLESVALRPGEYFDERFFAYYEDLDLAWRAQRKGWRGAYRHRARGLHARGGSVARSAGAGRLRGVLTRPAEVRFHVVKNRYLTLLRNETARGFFRSLPFLLLRDLATFLLLLGTRPGVLARLWRCRRLFLDAWRERGLDASPGAPHVEGGDAGGQVAAGEVPRPAAERPGDPGQA